MFATHEFERRILNTFNGITAVGVGTTFISLFLSNPTDTGMAGVEVQYTGYERQPITFTPPFDESGGIGIRSANDILFPMSTTDVGIARFIGIHDSSVAGNMLLYAELTIPLEIRAQQQPSVPIGDVMYFILNDTSRAFKTAILNVLRGQNLNGFTPHLALFDGDPEGTGVELSGGAYARPEVHFGAPVIQAGGHTQIQNTEIIRFPSPTTDWGLWGWDAIMSGATGAGLIIKMINPFPETIRRSYVPQFDVSSYRVAMN